VRHLLPQGEKERIHLLTPTLVIPVAMRTGIHYASQHIEKMALIIKVDMTFFSKKPIE
jgi:hypothetical protein